MVTLTREENTVDTIAFPNKATIDQLVEEFYKVKKDISLIEVPTASKTKALSERKHAIMWELKKALEKVNKRKGDKIRNKLWEELGVMI